MSWKFANDFSASVEEEFRFADDAQDFYYHHSDFGIAYSGIADWLNIGVNYRQVFEEKSGTWKEENRPHINATINFKLEDIDFSNRSRFEYREREDADDFWRYRDKTTIKFPIKLTKFEIQPYTADEIFFDFDKEELNENWLYGGIVFKIFKQLKGDLYYMWDYKNSTGDWVDHHILGTKLKVDF